MAILADDLWKAMRAVLGVAGTQRYLPDQQVLPAINGALRQFNGFVYSLLAERKGSEELMREVTITRIFQTNDLGGVIFNEAQLGHKVWTVNAVYPVPVTLPPDPSIQPIPPQESKWRDDVTLSRPGRFRCARVTLEELPDIESNSMMPGSEASATSPWRSYAYCLIGDRATDGWLANGTELVVLPSSTMGKKLIGISYMKGVEPVVSFSDTIPYPSMAFQLLRDLALNELSVRQGAKPLYDVTINSVRALLTAQS